MKRVKFAIDTKVPVINTRSEIETTLAKFGATSFAFASHADRATVMFEAASRRVRFELPLPIAKTEAHTARLHRERWRALFLAIKAKLVAVDTDIETFEDAFMAHIVLADGSTVGESVKPALVEQYKTGNMVPLLGPPGKGDAMSLTVVNPQSGEEAAMLGDDSLDLAKQIADDLAKTGGRWIVVRTTVIEETIYQTQATKQ